VDLVGFPASLVVSGKAAVAWQVSGRGVTLRQRQQAGVLQTLREVEGAAWGRGSAWTAAACRRCVGRAGVNSGLPAGCDHHGLKQGRSVLGLEEACCAHRDGGPAGWSICGRTSSGGTIGGRSGGTNCWTTGRWRRPARSNNVGSNARASSGVRRGRSPLVSGRFLGQGAAALTLADTRPGNLCKN
jgi:hypothetical protein